MANLNKIYLPELHEAQKNILSNLSQFNVVCAGRRFGKNVLLKDIIIKAALSGKRIAYLEPTYKMMIDIFNELVSILSSTIKYFSKSERKIILNTNGKIDLYSLTSVDNIRGKSYDVVCINECAQYENLKDNFEAAILPTLIDTGGIAVLTSTPKAERASTVFFKELFQRAEINNRWRSFHYTSYDNPFLKKSIIDEMKSQMTRSVQEQEINARFIDREDSIIKLSDIQYYNPSEVELDMGNTVMGVDLAVSLKDSADYTVFAIINKNNTTNKIYIIDIYRDRINFNTIIKQLKAYAEKYSPNVITIEKVGGQDWVIQVLQQETNYNIKGENPGSKDKTLRFQPLANEFQKNNVYINKEISEEFINELLSFPDSKTHDDSIDAISYAYLGFEEKPVFMVF